MWRWCPLMPCETVRSRSQKTKLLPPRHCSKIPTPSTPSTSLEPTLQCENCGERQDWQDHLGRRQLKTISFQNWTKWNRNFKLKSIETNCISTYLDNFEMTSSHHRHLSEELGHAMQPFCASSSVRFIPRRSRTWPSSSFLGSIGSTRSPGVTSFGFQLIELRYRSDPVALNILKSRSSQAKSDVKWSKMI